MAAAGVAALYRSDLRPRMYTWGAHDDEVTAALPGDDLVRVDGPRTTRAISIDVPPAAVWPWLAQIGEGRAGFYSYSILERAVGAAIHNADVVHPEWQDVSVGETIWLAHRYGDTGRQVVAAVQRGSSLVLMSPNDFESVRRGEKAAGAWQFCLREGPDGTSRLLVRGSGPPVGHAAFDIIHFVMERGMMRGIRRRAERASRQGADTRAEGQTTAETASAATHASTTPAVSP